MLPPHGIQIIGLVGGIASGKSLVAAEFKRLGAGILDADAAGHEVLHLPHVKEAIRERWGDTIFDKQGEVDRAALGKLVFSPAAGESGDLAVLERITHPEIQKVLERQAFEWAERGEIPVLVLDAPVMLKAGWNDICDRVLFVEAPASVRWTRAAARGWSKEDFSAREAAQESMEVKRRHADAIIDNSGSIESTRAQVELFWQSQFV